MKRRVIATLVLSLLIIFFCSYSISAEKNEIVVLPGARGIVISEPRQIAQGVFLVEVRFGTTPEEVEDFPTCDPTIKIGTSVRILHVYIGNNAFVFLEKNQ